MAISTDYSAELNQINSAVAKYFADNGVSQDYYNKPANSTTKLQLQLDKNNSKEQNQQKSLSSTFIDDLQEELDRKLAEVQMLKDQLILMDVKIDQYDTIIGNIDTEIIPLIDEINVAITSAKTAYDNRVSAGCSNDLYWEQIAQKSYLFGFGGGTSQNTIIQYQCKKNPNVRTDYSYYGAKYYRKPQNQDYGSNIIAEFSGTIGAASSSLAVLDAAGTSNLKVGDTIVDNIDHPVIFSSANLPNIVGFGTTSIVGTSTQFGGSISSGSTIIAHTGIGTTGDISIGDNISLSGVLSPNTQVVGFGTTTITLSNIWNPNTGTFISTSTTTDSLIVNIASIGNTSSGNFTIGILNTYPSLLLSSLSLSEAVNYNFTCIRSTQISSTTFDYSNNPSDPVTVGIMESSTIGLGHKLERVNNGYPIGPFQWKEIMTADFAGVPDSQLNPSQSYLRSTYPEPLCGASYARYYPGNTSWPIKYENTSDSHGGVIPSSAIPAVEGEIITISIGTTSKYDIGYQNTTTKSPAPTNCTDLQNAINTAESIRDAIIAKNLPKIDSLIASTGALRSIRDTMEGKAFAILQGRIHSDVEVNKLKEHISSLQTTNLSSYEPKSYYFNPDTGKTSSSTVGVGTEN